MAEFQTELEAGCLTDCTWRIVSPLVYISDLVGKIEVPINFKTDFASIPRLPIIYELLGNKAHYEGVVHDYLYRADSIPLVTRYVADCVLLEAMKVRKKNWITRNSVYIGVRIGGWTAYHRHTVNWKTRVQ